MSEKVVLLKTNNNNSQGIETFTCMLTTSNQLLRRDKWYILESDI